MLYLKVMSDQDLPDSDPSHDFVLIQLGDKDQLSFERRKGAACSSADGPVVYAVIDSEDSPPRDLAGWNCLCAKCARQDDRQPLAALAAHRRICPLVKKCSGARRDNAEIKPE
jgi:hypothetical protein